jgi:hypothetical protein
MNPTNAQPQKSRLPEIIALVLIVAAAGYYFYTSSGSNNSGASFTVTDASSSVGADVLNLLNQIQSLQINTTLFQSPVYQSLTDFTVQVPTEPIGKSNPFATGAATGNPNPESAASSSLTAVSSAASASPSASTGQ